MAKVPAVHREARFSGIRVAVSTEKSVLPDTQFLAQAGLRGFIDFVLDCSVAISWILPDEYSDYAEKILNLLDEKQAIVPSIWYLEIANVLLVSERRGRIDLSENLNASL